MVLTFGGTASAQDDPEAVQAAMSILIQRHSTHADTIAKEISFRFRKSAPMQTALAWAYYRNNEHQKARHYLIRSMAADPKYSVAYVLYGDTYGEWNVDSAAYWYNRAVQERPNNPEGYVKYASVMARNDMEAALKKLEELRKAVPHYPVDVEIAGLYDRKGDSKAAVAALSDVDVEELSMNQLAQYMQNCYWSADDKKALEVGEVAMRKYPDHYGFNRVYAWSAVRSGMYSEALANINKWFARATPDSINSIDYLVIGTAYMGEGDYGKAFDYLERINLLTDDYFAPQMPGQIAQAVNRNVERLKAQGEYGRAADLYSRYIDTYPSASDQALQYYNLAQIYRSQQEALEGEEKLEVIRKMFDVYTLMEERYPTWSNIHYVLYTHARWTYSYFDPENEQSLARPYYEMLYNTLVQRGELTPQGRGMMVEACQYMASDSYFQKQNLPAARVWRARILENEPDNQAAKDALEKIKS